MNRLLCGHYFSFFRQYNNHMINKSLFYLIMYFYLNSINVKVTITKVIFKNQFLKRTFINKYTLTNYHIFQPICKKQTIKHLNHHKKCIYQL